MREIPALFWLDRINGAAGWIVFKKYAAAVGFFCQAQIIAVGGDYCIFGGKSMQFKSQEISYFLRFPGKQADITGPFAAFAAAFAFKIIHNKKRAPPESRTLIFYSKTD